MSRRRSRTTPTLTVIHWRDIPAQVTATTGQEKETVALHHRFQDAIDRSAAVAGLTAAHDYVNEWRRVATPLADDPAEAVIREAERLDAEYPPSRLHRMVKQGGLEPENGGTPAP